jgi:hypothetical protein
LPTRFDRLLVWPFPQNFAPLQGAGDRISFGFPNMVEVVAEVNIGGPGNLLNTCEYLRETQYHAKIAIASKGLDFNPSNITV